MQYPCNVKLQVELKIVLAIGPAYLITNEKAQHSIHLHQSK